MAYADSAEETMVMWQHANVGASTGSSAQSNGVFSVTAVSPGTLLTVDDAFRYVYRRCAGDCRIEIRIADIINHVPRTSVAGVMWRESLDAKAAYVSCLVVVKNKRANLRFRVRAKHGRESANIQSISGIPLPCWVRLVRVGDSFTAFHSLDGKDFSEFSTGTVAIGLAEAALIGIIVSQENEVPGNEVRATIDQVVVAL
jgi:hypothetical protein